MQMKRGLYGAIRNLRLQNRDFLEQFIVNGGEFLDLSLEVLGEF